MDCSDVEVPSCFKQINRKARKKHKCCECYNPIMPGEKYVYSSGIWDGKANDYKQCMICSEVAGKFAAMNDCAIAFGFLRTDLSDHKEHSDTYESLAKDLDVSVDKIKHVLRDYWFRSEYE